MGRDRNPNPSTGNSMETTESGRASILKMAFVRGRSLTPEEEKRVAKTNQRPDNHWRNNPPR